MKSKIVTLFLFIIGCSLSYADTAWRVLTMPEPKQTYKTDFVISGITLAIGGVFQGMVVKESDDANYADHALRDSYAMGEMGMSDADFMGYQQHYLDRLERHKEREGLYQGVAWSMFGVGVIALVKGFYDLHSYNKNYSEWIKNVRIKPDNDFSGGELAYEWRWK